MSFNISNLLQQMMTKKSIEFDAETLDEQLSEFVATLGAFENKSFEALDSSAREDLKLTKDESIRISQCVPALNLMRCSSFEGEIDWVDSFLWLVSDTYKLLSTTDQETLAKEFLNFIKKSKRFSEFFFTKLQKYPAVLEKIPILDKESAEQFLNGEDTPNIATLVALVFGYAVHIFSLVEDDFLDPAYTSDIQYQDKKPALFFITSETGHIEPLFQLTAEEFSAEFSWNDATLCQLKKTCNQYIDPEYTLPTEASCKTLPSGDSLETLDTWVRYSFSTRIVVKEDDQESPKEQPIENDSSSYPIPKLADKIISTRKDKEKEIIKRIEVSLPLQVAAQAKITENGWYTAKTVGDGTCLLHSFLQSTSPLYRSIPNDERALVGQWFRRAVLLPNYEEEDDADKARVMETQAWLEHFDVQKLTDIFQLNILIISTTNNLLNIFKPMSGFRGKPYIFILNSSEVHYSSIYLDAQKKFMLTEDEMRELYPEIVADMYNDEEYTDVRQEVVDFVRSTGAEEGVKNTIVDNIFRHERPRSGEPEPVAPVKHARNLEGAFNRYAEKLGVPPTNFNAFRQRVRNTARGGRRTKIRKTLKANS